MNMKKRCCKCKEEKETSEFPINKTTNDGFGYSCKKCQNEYTRAHYNKNKKQYLDRNKRRTKEAREYVVDLKKKSVCKCGENRWWVLEFHHNDNKKEEINKLLTHGITIVKREIKKCEIMCANCHRDFHHQEKCAHSITG
jgi:hypothetical protein